MAHFEAWTRRQFIGCVGTACAMSTVSWRRLEAAQPDARIAAILDRAITVDLHNHGGLPPQAGSPSAGQRPRSGLPVAEAMTRARTSVVCLSNAVDGPLMQVGAGAPEPGTRSNLKRDPKPGEMVDAHRMAEGQYDALFAAQASLVRVRTYADIEAAHRERRPAIIQDTEGADFLENGHLDRIDAAYARGLRKVQLVHYAVNDIADFQVGPVDHHGLSAFGADVVRRCQKLGIVIDAAHMTFDGVKGVVKAASKPIVLSHTALYDSKAQAGFGAEGFRGGLDTLRARQVKPEHAKAVADTGGVVGVWHLFASAESYVRGVREMADVIGIDHVAIGMDWGVERTNEIWPGQTEGMMPTVVGEMLKQGFTPDECAKVVGGNACRVLRACLSA